MIHMHISTILRRNSDLMDSCSSRILLCGKSFISDYTGALYWPSEQTLIVSDLHLEKGSHLTEDKMLSPPYDTRSALEKLEETIDRYDPERVIALGDSFCHGARLSVHDIDWLRGLVNDREWLWVVGESKQPVPDGVGGVPCHTYTLGNIKFRYTPVKAPVAHEIAGKMHPVARISEYGHSIRTRCFVSNGLRLIMPSLGTYSAGRNVLDDEFAPLLGRGGLFIWMITTGKVYPIAAGQLIDETS